MERAHKLMACQNLAPNAQGQRFGHSEERFSFFRKMPPGFRLDKKNASAYQYYVKSNSLSKL